METTPHKVNISDTDRLGMTLFLAVMLHALIILGISFSSDKGKDPDILSRLDITLVQHKSEKAPEKADYLAQANQLGGGSQKNKSQPKQTLNTLICREKTTAKPATKNLFV